MEFLEILWRGIRGLIRRPNAKDSERELAKDAIAAVAVLVIIGLLVVAIVVAVLE